jgi:starch phosphorylase
VFLPDLNLKSAQLLYPAADLAEHISLAGTEAADTGNMIFALNGSRLIGTPDGSNLEIREAIGADQFFLFGQTVEQVMERRAQGYHPLEIYQTNPELKTAIDQLTSSPLVGNNLELFRPLVNLLLYSDQYMVLADYPSYMACQEQVSHAYQDPERWTEQAILATARMGRFSADRAVRNYCQAIWQIPLDQSQSTPASAQELPAKK